MVKTKPQTVPVTFRAVVQRLKRALAKDGRSLKAARSERVRLDLGAYYIVDNARNLLVDKHTDVVQMAREYGVLEDYEEVVDDE